MKILIKLSFLLITVGCSHREHIELAPYMANLQRYSAKLGHSIHEENKDLSLFYTEELKETASEVIEKFPTYDELPVATMTQTLVSPLIEALEMSIQASNWKTSIEEYKSLINGCNDCHIGTEHSFIKITPSLFKNVGYNQDFSSLD